MPEKNLPPPLPQTSPLPTSAVPPPLPATPPPLPQNPPPLPTGAVPPPLPVKKDFYFFVDKDIVFVDKAEADMVCANPDAVIQRTPQTAVDYLLRGKAYAYKGEHDSAIADYKKALETQPNAIDALANIAFAYFGKKDYDESVNWAGKLLKVDNECFYGYLARAYAASRKNEYEKAAVEWTNVIQRDPDCEHWYNWCGYALIQKALLYPGFYDGKHNTVPENAAREIFNDLKEAVDKFSMALKLKPDYTIAIYRRGNTYCHIASLIDKNPYAVKGDQKKALVDFLRMAVADLAEAVRLSPGKSDYVQLLADASKWLSKIT